MRVGQLIATVNDPETNEAVDVHIDALELIVDLPGVYLLEARKRTLDDCPFHLELHEEPMIDMVARYL